MKRSRLKLIVEKGPKKGTIIECEQDGEIRIGRFVKGNTFVIYDSAVSQNHLLVGFNCGRWVVSDLDTSNGTLLNDESIPPHKPCAIKDGDVIKIGARSVLFVVISEEYDAIVEDQPSSETRTRGNPKSRAGAVAPSRRRIPKSELEYVDVSDKISEVLSKVPEKQNATETNTEADKLGKKPMDPSLEVGVRRNPRRRAAPPPSSRRLRVPKTEPLSVDVSRKTSKSNSEFEDVGDIHASARVNQEADEPVERGNNAASGVLLPRQLEISDGLRNEEDPNIDVKASLELANGKNVKLGASPTATSRRTRIPKIELVSVDVCGKRSKDASSGLGSDQVGDKQASVEVNADVDEGGRKMDFTECGELSAQQLQVDDVVDANATMELGDVDACGIGVSRGTDLESGECGEEEHDARLGKATPWPSETEVPGGLDKSRSSEDGDVVDIEKITLGQWLDRLERRLPNEIRDTCESFIALMRERAAKVQDFVSQQGTNHQRV